MAWHSGQSPSICTDRVHLGAVRSSSARLGDQHRDAGILEHEGEALCGIGGIERQIGAAGFENAEQPDHHLQRALDAQPDHRLRSDAEAAQVMRELVGARIEFGIGEAFLPNTTATASGCARPGPRTAPAGWWAGSHGRCRSTRAGWCGARRRTECRRLTAGEISMFIFNTAIDALESEMRCSNFANGNRRPCHRVRSARDEEVTFPVPWWSGRPAMNAGVSHSSFLVTQPCTCTRRNRNYRSPSGPFGAAD